MSEDQGLLVFDNAGSKVSQVSGKYTQASFVDLPGKKDLVLAINASDNAVELFSWNNQHLTEIERFAEPVAELTGICSYYQPNENAVYSFLLRDEQPVVHRVHYIGPEAKAVSMDVRHLAGGASLVGCVVNDVTEQVYFLEENVGIWHTNAHPERDSVRTIDWLAPDEEDVPAVVVSAQGHTLAVHGADIYDLSQGPKASPVKTVNHLAGLDGLALRFDLQARLEVLSVDDSADPSVKVVSLDLPNIEPSTGFSAVIPDVETQHVGHYGDAADDPAIWVNEQDPENSLIFGTDKKRGLLVYDLKGKQRQFLATGKVNNVDLRTLDVNGKPTTLVSASNRDTNGISLYQLDHNKLSLSFIGDFSTGLDEVYGLCSSVSGGKYTVLINDKDGRYQVFAFEQRGSKFSHRLVTEFALKDQPEGCVVEDKTQTVFMGVENYGIYKGVLTSDSLDELTEIAVVGGPLQADVEGMELYQNGQHDYLVVSSQGNNSYAFYQTQAPHAYLGTVLIEANFAKGIDGASETDGLAVTGKAIGDIYPHGLLVVQDGRNVLPVEPQNFKYVDFKQILDSLAKQNGKVN